MKKLIALIVLGASLCAFAANPAATVVDADWDQSTVTKTITGASDTIAATDSITVIDSWGPDNGWEHILVIGPVVGSGDSVEIALRLDAINFDGDLLMSETFDSLSSETGEAFLIPIRTTVIGPRYRLKMIGGGDNGAETVFDNIEIMKRRRSIGQRRLKTPN